MNSKSLYPDGEVLHLLAEGDAAAFRQIYNTYWNSIYSLALTYLKSPQLAQDIVQDVFLKVWDKRKSFASVKDPAAFIYVIGRNAVINAFKTKINPTGIEDKLNTIPDDFLLPNLDVELKQLQQEIASLVNQLPPQQRLIIKLSREDGLSHEEIADQLGIGKTTVKNHIVRALNTLRTRLSIKAISLVICFLSVICD